MVTFEIYNFFDVKLFVYRYKFIDYMTQLKENKENVKDIYLTLECSWEKHSPCGPE